MPRALEGLRVVEFGAYAAGPHIGKMLANFGATVVHVESRAHPDGFRLQYPPYKGGRPSLEGSGCFAYFNDSKLGATLDLKNARGVALARRLAAACDVVIENMRPGVMARIGLGFEVLEASNPRLIMLSSCNMGQTGPRADTPGFGSQLTALAGIAHLTGESGGPPMLLYGP
jgi:crotonobetainyl-CoA:carnitine CoA-transferase CaiB-like acyl-CoA transferase